MKTILFVNQFLPHYRQGVFEFVQNQIPGVQVAFAADLMLPGNSIEPMDVRRIADFRRLKNVWIGPILWQRGLLRTVRRHHFDAVVFVGDMKYASTWSAALMLRLFSSTRVLFWTIGWHRSERGIRRILRLTFYRLAHHLLIYGNIGRDLGVEHGYPRDRMTVVYNSLPPEPAGPSNPNLKRAVSCIPASDRVVGAVIRLNAAKRLELLIEAVKQLRESGLGLSVLLVGDGAERQPLIDLADEAGVPLCAPGPAYNATDLASVYECMDVCVVPGAIGLTAIQSLQYGVPVVSHREFAAQGPEVEAVKEGVTGSLVPKDDVAALAAAIEEWLARDAQSVAESCRREVTERWTPEASGGRVRDAILTEIGRS